MHFFIDHLEIGTQEAGDGYGADVTNPETLYNVTSRFQLTNEAKAFACQESLMIVQQSSVDASLINLILKPKGPLAIALAVKYYVYRGILKSSLIIDSNDLSQAPTILSKDPTNNELIARIWKDPPQDTGAGTLGFDRNTFAGTDSVETVFDNSRTGVRPILVKEGEWIGTFSKKIGTVPQKIGFEVILATDRLSVDLNHVRNEMHQVDATNLTGFDERAKREEVLYFIDPAAFFGMHYSKGVKYSTYSGATKTTKSTIEKVGNAYVNNTYSLLVNPFLTRNRVYLDVRSEKGYSYNFYQNYCDPTPDNHNIKIGYGIVGKVGTVEPVSQEYKTKQWPIVFIEAAQTTTTSQNTLRFNLRIDDNTSPIIYIENKGARDTNQNLNHIKDIVAPGGWTKEIKFVFPNTGAGMNIATYIKCYYFRRKHTSASPNTVLSNLRYYDSAFCSVDIRKLGDPAVSNEHVRSPDPSFVSEPLQTNGTGNFGYTAITGAYWDSERILFYSILEATVVGNTSEKFYINTYTRKLNMANQQFSNLLGRDVDIRCFEYSTDGGNIKIPTLNYYTKACAISEKENALLLGLSIPEISAIRTAVGLSDKHSRYLFLEPDATNPNPLTDNNAFRYNAYTLRLQGLNENGIPDLITPLLNQSPILVYSRDNSFFSSIAFSTAEAISPGQNRIEFHIYNNGTVKINDNIDLSLVRKTTDEDPADISLEQQISYVYRYAEDLTNTVEVCSLDVLEIFKLKAGKEKSSLPAGTVKKTIDYTPYNNDGVNAKTSYIYNNGNVVTIGKKKLKNNVVNENFIMLYENAGKKTFLVHLEAINLATLNIEFSFDNSTRRFYCRPEVVAALIGALVDFGAFVDTPPTNISSSIISTGSGYEDGSAFPSYEHNNGEAIDTLYYKTVAGLTQAQRVARDQSFINAMQRFGFKKRKKGTGAYHNLLINASKDLNGGHEDHLHCGDLELNSNFEVDE